VFLTSVLAPGTYLEVCWVVPRGGMEGFLEKKSVSLAGIRTPDLSACNLVATTTTLFRPRPFPREHQITLHGIQWGMIERK